MEWSLSLVASSAASMAWRYALAFFLVVVAIGLVYLLAKAGKTLASVEKMVADMNREVVPLMGKVGTTVDEINAELDKVNEITGSVVDMTQKIDSTTRAVESAISTPAKKAAAFTSGVQQAVNSFLQRFRGGAAPAGAGATSERVYSPPIFHEPAASPGAGTQPGKPGAGPAAPAEQAQPGGEAGGDPGTAAGSGAAVATDDAGADTAELGQRQGTSGASDEGGEQR
jgi:uncharacterized protein YoxC